MGVIDDVLDGMPRHPIVLEGERLASAERDEWLLTTGDGGFAMGCPTGVPHRQYHGYLNAAWRPPTGRVQTLHSVEESVGGTGLRVERFARRCAGVEWVLRGAGVTVTKRLRVGFRANTCALRYRVEADGACALELRPNITMRDMHHAPGETDPSRFVRTEEDDGVRVEAGGHAMVLRWDAGAWSGEERLSEHVTYGTALARTDEDEYGERLWSPGVLRLACGAGVTECTLMCALSPTGVDGGLFDHDEREEHLNEVFDRSGLDDRLRVLVGAADDFLVERTVGDRALKTVIAGYPWFGDWGRDTMIALPGLMLTTRRFGDARACLETFAAYVSDGMIPNLFDEDDTPAYNTVDASLWFLHAVHAFVRASGEMAGDVLLGACHAIIEGYRNGTRYGIGVDKDGLVYAGDANTQLTWMDAKRGGVAFSPRYGKCVEINALWVHGLRCVASMIGSDVRAAEYTALAERASVAFNDRFVRDDGLGLYDCLRPVNGEWMGIDEIRPNQVFAVSLERSPLAREHWRGVVDVCREHLLTPAGMRTLSSADPGYRGRFKGNMMERDGAYHNGTVWPWPIGAYCEAVLRVGDFGNDAEREVGEALRGLVGDLWRGCLGQVAEVYDGDPPRDQEGCCAQAWSVAEVLRTLGR